MSLTTGSIILFSTFLGHIYDIIIEIYTKMKVDKPFINNNNLEECEDCDECGKHVICKRICVKNNLLTVTVD